MQASTKLKVLLYFVFLSPFFALVALASVDLGALSSLPTLLENNWLAMVSLLLAILGLACVFLLKSKWNGAYNPPYEIETLEHQKHSSGDYCALYLCPLFCPIFSDVEYVVVMLPLLVLIGYVFISRNLYFGHPVLALMGYRLYRAKIKGQSDEITLLSKDILYKGTSVRWISVEDDVWVAKAMNK